MSHKKFGPDRFSRFDVYWIQTYTQTDNQTDKPNLYIDAEATPEIQILSIMTILLNHSSVSTFNLRIIA